MKDSFGVPDELFLRGKVPMTKAEIRAITLAKARISSDSIVYDIGCGTGSITVAAATLAKQGKVFALEKNPEGIELTQKNVSHFGLTNVKILQTEAPQGLQDLPPANSVIIGGSSGKLTEILMASQQKLQPGGSLVINAITLETFTTALQFLESRGFQAIDAVAVTVARLSKVGTKHLWQGLNPIYIISAINESQGG